MTPEKHCRLPMHLTLDQVRWLWADLPEKQRMEVLKSVIWTAPDAHDFYAKAMTVLNSRTFIDGID